MNDTEITRRLLGYIGFAARSGNISVGSELTLKAIRHSAGKGGIAALLASDASERTKKQVSDKCAFYKVFLVTSDATSDEIGTALGKTAPVAAAAVTDKNLAAAIKKLYTDNT